MELFASLDKHMEKDQAITGSGLRSSSSLVLLPKKKTDLLINLAVLQMKQTCFTHKKLMEF